MDEGSVEIALLWHVAIIPGWSYTRRRDGPATGRRDFGIGETSAYRVKGKTKGEENTMIKLDQTHILALERIR